MVQGFVYKNGWDWYSITSQYSITVNKQQHLRTLRILVEYGSPVHHRQAAVARMATIGATSGVLPHPPISDLPVQSQLIAAAVLCGGRRPCVVPYGLRATESRETGCWYRQQTRGCFMLHDKRFVYFRGPMRRIKLAEMKLLKLSCKQFIFNSMQYGKVKGFYYNFNKNKYIDTKLINIQIKYNTSCKRAQLYRISISFEKTSF